MNISKTAFRLTKLAMVIGVAGVTMNAQAVYNLYKKDGFTLDINGQVDVQATKQDYKHEVLHDWDAFDWLLGYENGVRRPYRNTMANTYTKTSTDKEARLGQTHGVSFLDIRGSQILPYDWRVTGNIGLGYQSDRNMYLSNSSLSLDKKNIGAITLGRQFLHTNYVNRTGTDTPLDIFSSSALRLDYYAPKGLHASAYYSFASINDVRNNDNTGIKSGYGASLSYRVPFAPNQSVRFGAGYTVHTANPKYDEVMFGTPPNRFDYGWADNNLNRYPAKAEGAALSVEYQAGKLLLAADVGQKKETMSKDTRTLLDTKKSDYLGAKIAYDITPVWQMSVGYGIKKTNTTLKRGVAPLAFDWDNGDWGYIDGDEKYLFDKAKTKETYFQTDYRIRPNVRLYGRYDTEATTYTVADKDFGKEKDNNIRAGVVFTF